MQHQIVYVRYNYVNRQIIKRECCRLDLNTGQFKFQFFFVSRYHARLLKITVDHHRCRIDCQSSKDRERAEPPTFWNGSGGKLAIVNNFRIDTVCFVRPRARCALHKFSTGRHWAEYNEAGPRRVESPLDLPGIFEIRSQPRVFPNTKVAIARSISRTVPLVEQTDRQTGRQTDE